MWVNQSVTYVGELDRGFHSSIIFWVQDLRIYLLEKMLWVKLLNDDILDLQS